MDAMTMNDGEGPPSRYRVHVIAEVGSNHNGQPALAKRLITIAARAGAASEKFRIINPDLLIDGTSAEAF